MVATRVSTQETHVPHDSGVLFRFLTGQDKAGTEQTEEKSR